MRLYDENAERLYSLPELKAEYIPLRSADPYNHAPDFKTELLEIIMATVNGRNDCDIVGPSPAELSRIVAQLRKTLEV